MQGRNEDFGPASMAAIDAKHTLSRLQHWQTRLAVELEVLKEDIASSEAMHQKYGGKCSEALLALRALRVEKDVRLGEVLSAIHSIKQDIEQADALSRSKAFYEKTARGGKPAPAMMVHPPRPTTASLVVQPAALQNPWRPAPALKPVPAAAGAEPGTRTHATMIRSPILAHSTPRRLVFG